MVRLRWDSKSTWKSGRVKLNDVTEVSVGADSVEGVGPRSGERTPTVSRRRRPTLWGVRRDLPNPNPDTSRSKSFTSHSPSGRRSKKRSPSRLHPRRSADRSTDQGCTSVDEILSLDPWSQVLVSTLIGHTIKV